LGVNHPILFFTSISPKVFGAGRRPTVAVSRCQQVGKRVGELDLDFRRPLAALGVRLKGDVDPLNQAGRCCTHLTGGCLLGDLIQPLDQRQHVLQRVRLHPGTRL
jgi:hypothetical protein